MSSERPDETQAAPKIDETTLVCRTTSMLSAKIGNEVVMMHLTTGRYVGLDDISGDIWQRLENPRRFGELIDELAADYDAERAVIAEDVRRLVGEMVANDIVQIGGADSPG